MQKIWLCALPLALTTYFPMSADAAGRVQDGSSVYAAVAAPPASADLGPGAYVYADPLKSHGRARGDAAREAAASVCDRGMSRTIGSAPFNACMRARGWRFVQFQPARGDDSASRRLSIRRRRLPTTPAAMRRTPPPKWPISRRRRTLP
jgi:hypothetical protein